MIFSSLNINKEEKINVQIQNHVKREINKGILKKGSKLPSTREVSKILGISRNSVILAYENLENEGIIETFRGKGTFIAIEKEIKDDDFKVRWGSLIEDYGVLCEKLDVVKTELPWKKGMISFKSIAPDESLFDLEEFKRAFLNVFSIEGDKLLNYGYAKGYKPLIEYIKTYMENKGVLIEKKDILITNGFTEAFNIILSTLTNPNDIIACENPTHNTAIKIMKTYGLNIKPIRMDDDGINLESLEYTLKQYKPKLIYLIPSYHNPTGIVMDGEKRQNVYNICKKYKVPIIEDGFNEELVYSSSHVAPLVALSNRGNGVIYAGSFSKILFPGIRIGWIFADKELINVLESVKRSKNIHTSFIDQGVFHKYMESGSFKRYVKKIRKHYKDRYDFTIKEIEKHIPKEKVLGNGGLYVFVKLENLDSRDVLNKCYERGVVFMPGDIFFVNKEEKNWMRIGFSRTTKKEIEKGIRIIGEVIDELNTNKNK